MTVVISGLLTLTITWWYRALDPLSSNKYAIFDRRDIAPIGYALFAFAAGALIGAVIQRTVHDGSSLADASFRYGPIFGMSS